MATTECYLQVLPQWSTYYRDDDGNAQLNGIRIAKVLQRRPARFEGTLIKLTLRIPDGAFKPLSPKVIIDIPPEALEFEPEVTVELPERGDHG